MSEPVETPLESLEYRTEVKQLLDILAHSLYTDREIFLRELISNASDALNRIQFEMLTNHEVVDPDAELAIHIEVDDEAKVITLRDSGIGMNRDEMVENLGTIAHSGARTFLEKAGEGKSTQEEIIGQFGVGFYSVFMVAEDVVVTSRSYRPQDDAAQWESKGDSRFSLAAAEKRDRGTEIRIKLKEDAAEFASTWRMESIVKKHSDYVSFPIYVKGTEGEAKVANRRTALWRQSPSKVEAGEYDDFYKQLTFDDQDPLLHIHMVADAPANVRSILYVPTRRERGSLRMRPDHGLRLYSRKILIQEHNKDLLPEYMRFVEGVVDSEDLPLNVSRETVQSNPVTRQLRKALTGRLLKDLKNLAEQDADKYGAFWTEFGVFVKEGITADFANRESLQELLRFRSTRSGADEWVTVKQYVERMKPDQAAIYFILGDSLKSAARSPHLDYFRKHDIEVLYLTDFIDGYMASQLREIEGKPLQNVDDANLELPKDEAAETPEANQAGQEAFDQLVTRARAVLGERVRDVREGKTLVDSPARLVSPDDGFERDMQYVRRILEEDYVAPAKILELNRSHPIVVNLANLLSSNAESSLVNPAVEQLFDNLQLLDGAYQGSVADMVVRIQQLMAAALEK
ncbi:MAG: molecular chaperone HtpG [Caldilinea sp.]|nr:molecular chaperone HtpG [Caldilinea sp.]MCB0056167.1 molecular chaperone HtpG [Caldilineaceae bacterium]MCB0040480.1 molecular chaperone HtpG [Caldilinea sp.]MCB0066101.1 molecular chaperone HtpG [Caldilineaceae bacterium]MCB9115224.1 molecular chaperone HtpG [Caldilineaceae bacterium]